MDWSLRLLAPPVGEPMSLAQAKQHLKIADDLTEEDDTVQLYITSAREYLEQTFNVRFVKQRVEFIMADFPDVDRFHLPLWPVQSIDYFTYTGLDNVARVMTEGQNYDTRLFRKPAEVVLPFAQVWPPIVLKTADAIRVGLTVGYLRGDSPETLPVPAGAMGAMRLLLGHQYENRSAVTLGTLEEGKVLPMGVTTLMQSARLF